MFITVAGAAQGVFRMTMEYIVLGILISCGNNRDIDNDRPYDTLWYVRKLEILILAKQAQFFLC